MLFPVKEAVQKRKSVRSFDGRPLSDADRAALEQYIASVQNPFGIDVEFRLLDAGKNGLTSPVVVGADAYIAAKAAKEDRFEIGYGYSFESVCLYAASLGIGTVILAASLNRAAFEKAMDLQLGDVMPVATPVGYPAAKKTVRDTLMRKGLKADDRIAFDRLFFDGAFGTGLRPENAGAFADALEMVRWAPSATNRQPWRAVVAGNTVHFYEEKTLKDSPLGDIQKVDLGIALAHFDLTMQENGFTGKFIEADPGFALPENTEYIISYERAE